MKTTSKNSTRGGSLSGSAPCSPQAFDLVYLQGHTDRYRCYSHRGDMIYVGQNSDTVRTSDDAQVESIIQENALFGSWLPPESAPLNGTLILGDFGWPWPNLAVWDPYDEQWCVATVQASPMQDGADNYWLEADTENKSRLKRWMPLPHLPHARAHTPA